MRFNSKKSAYGDFQSIEIFIRTVTVILLRDKDLYNGRPVL